MATTFEARTEPLEPPPREVPRLANGVELIGRFEDSGFKEPPYIARRSDGQVVQLAPVLYALAEEVDGQRDTGQIAESLSHRIQRSVEPEMVEMLLEEQLRRLGLVKQRNGVTAEVGKLDPLLALKFRVRVVPARAVRALTTIFRPLFWPPVMLAAVAGLLAVDAWLFGFHGVSQGLRHVLYQPALLVALLGGVVLATAFHEIGHATAVRYGGAEPGVMGVGIYIVWPAFYTDITDAYRLGKWGRLRADVGGMYFNAIVALAAAGAYFATGFEPLLLLVVLQNFAIVQQSLPLLRLDGYYIVSDLTGVPDILGRIRPVFASLLPWRRADERVTALRPWVRVVVTGYVLVVVPVLVLAFALMLVHAPRAFATAYDSLAVRWARVGGEPTSRAAIDVLQMAVLTLPCLGMLYTTARVSARAGRALPRGPVLVAAATAVACLAFLWWPHGDYRPIQPGERGTIVSGFRSLPHVASGRAAVPVAPAAGPAPAAAAPRRSAAPARKPVAPAPKPAATTEQRATTVPAHARPRSAASPESTPSYEDTPPDESYTEEPPPSDTTTTETSPSETTTTETTTTETTPAGPTDGSPPPGG